VDESDSGAVPSQQARMRASAQTKVFDEKLLVEGDTRPTNKTKNRLSAVFLFYSPHIKFI